MCRSLLFPAAVLCLALASSGCVTVYQPLKGLQRPTVVQLDEDNFKDVRVQLRCGKGDATAGERNKLCRKLQKVFSNQGAVVDTGGLAEVPRGAAAAPKPDLIIDVESRFMSDDTDRFFSVLCVLTATLVPWITDTSLAQDVTIRDGDGFLLASQSYEARFVRYVGLGVWAVNALLDLFLRSPDEKLTGTNQNAVISKDFYRQLSQLAFHARTRELVLRTFEPPK